MKLFLSPPSIVTSLSGSTRLIAAGVLAGVLAVAWMATGKPQTVASFERPDHRYKVVVSRRSNGWFGAMPGQSGDAPGVVRLYDRAGRVLQQARVEMVQVVEGVEWDDHRVVIKLVADWPLPD